MIPLAQPSMRAAVSLALTLTAAAAALPGEEKTMTPSWLPAYPHHLPRWRGFNLLEKFHRDWSNRPFVEEDFRLIARWGFNFVRLPMDYRTWIQGDDWTQFNEATLREIDQAVAWGEQYGIHVMLNFHRAPGYTVASPPEERSLWTDPEAQRVCALHWGMFARRYRGIPSERLSFNLMNEPANVDPKVYVAVVQPIIEAIRREDPDRLIVSDGLSWGTQPILELAELHVAQATRGYLPMTLTHYRASWVQGADQYPLPTWPMVVANGILASPDKADLKPEAREPLVVEGAFPPSTRLRLHVMQVTSGARLAVKADGQVVWEKRFLCGPGEGEWKEARLLQPWNVYQNLYDRDYTMALPPDTQRVEIGVVEGDWLRVSELGISEPEGPEAVLPLTADWNRRPAQVQYRPGHPDGPFRGAEQWDRQWLWETAIVPWKEAEARGIGVMVGEFGAFNQTPHDVVLRWMEDCLKNWQAAGWGWALWNFRGSFGILDSGRADVAYEDFEGHQLDRQMLELLQRY